MTKSELKQLIKECILEMSTANVKVGNYKYQGFNPTQEQQIKDKVIQYHSTQDQSFVGRQVGYTIADVVAKCVWGLTILKIARMKSIAEGMKDDH